jgi:hypothetical protein
MLFFHFLFCPAPLPVYLPCLCPGHKFLTFAHILLIPMACRGWKSAYPEFMFPWSRDTCLRHVSKQLEPCTDWINGIIYKILKITSRSPFFREATK